MSQTYNTPGHDDAEMDARIENGDGVMTSAAELRDALNRHDDALCAIAGAAVILVLWLAAIL